MCQAWWSYRTGRTGACTERRLLVCACTAGEPGWMTAAEAGERPRRKTSAAPSTSRPDKPVRTTREDAERGIETLDSMYILGLLIGTAQRGKTCRYAPVGRS